MFESWPGGSWEATVRYLLAVLLLYLAAVWVALIFWTYRDIRQRTRDPVLQTVAVLLVLLFFLPGHWVYLIVRPRYTLVELYERSLEEEALLQELEDQKACPTCRRRVHDDFLVCPSCRTQLKEPCRQCGRPLSYAWVACPYCGLEKAPREGYGPRPARAPQPRQFATPGPGWAPASPAPRPAAQPNPAPPQGRIARDPFGGRATPQPSTAEPDDGPIIGG